MTIDDQLYCLLPLQHLLLQWEGASCWVLISQPKSHQMKTEDSDNDLC